MDCNTVLLVQTEFETEYILRIDLYNYILTVHGKKVFRYYYRFTSQLHPGKYESTTGGAVLLETVSVNSSTIMFKNLVFEIVSCSMSSLF